MKRLVLLTGLLLAACGATTGTCPTSSTLTYETFGQAYVTKYCVACHGALNASEGVSLTSVALVRVHLTKVDSEVARGSMPPRGSTAPTAKEDADLSTWLACGAP